MSKNRRRRTHESPPHCLRNVVTTFTLAVALLIPALTSAEPLPPMLKLPDPGEDPALIDFKTLPVLKGVTVEAKPGK